MYPPYTTVGWDDQARVVQCVVERASERYHTTPHDDVTAAASTDGCGHSPGPSSVRTVTAMGLDSLSPIPFHFHPVHAFEITYCLRLLPEIGGAGRLKALKPALPSTVHTKARHGYDGWQGVEMGRE
jgi:hypothetical protein